MAFVSKCMLLLFLCFTCCMPVYTVSDDLELLLQIKTSFQKSNSSLFASWHPDNSVCNFTGISCGSGAFVVEIDLSRNNLTGELPLNLICQLRSLEKLAFGYNSLEGKVTEDLNKCVYLKHLDLGYNNFTGSFPDISSLNKLEVLSINMSGFSGVFPWRSLANMTHLEFLSVGDNPFKVTPFPLEVLELANLNWLYMSKCGIGGSIPDGIGKLTKLRNLELAQNSLTGEIPASISSLTNLWQLELYENNVTGRIPVGFGKLTNLQKFDASSNKLQGDLSELRQLTNLVSLQLFENHFHGEVPAEFGEFHKLVNLSLYRNNLTGPLPPLLGSWAEFDFIDVSENNFTGSIPPHMCQGGTMRALLMLDNSLTGEIPESYENCTSMVRFRVSDNFLSGKVPSGLWGLPRAEIIDLEFNNLEGSLTPDIQNAKSLKQLFIGNNRFSGELPSEIFKAIELVSVELDDNEFSGVLPKSIGELEQLSDFLLQNNKFSGSIPGTLGSCVALSNLNLANNSFSGEIPSSIGHLQSLTFLDLSGNSISGRIPSSLSSLKLSFLNLSSNRLSGALPAALEPYNGSFSGNPDLCSLSNVSFRQCSSDSKMAKRVVIMICLIATLILLILALVWMMLGREGERSHDRSLKEEAWHVSSYQVLTFSENEILDSIKDENVIGKGGSGNVYKVALRDGHDLAVKHIWHPDSNHSKKNWSSASMIGKRRTKTNEFDAEAQTLSSIRHINVVKLYCSITSEESSLLVYEYLPNGSLWDKLHSTKKGELDWQTRYEIALGSAKGLEYLHHGCEKPVIHRDVKSSNILLDEFLKPRIADFGLAKIMQLDGGKESTQIIAGTHGYIAPEYGYTCKVNEKSDVYSFGVVLMELVSGKRPIEPEFGEHKDIVDWVASKLSNEESVFSIVDTQISDVFTEDAIRVLQVAVLCTARSPSLRPSMRSVVQMLEKAEPCQLVGIVIAKDKKRHE